MAAGALALLLGVLFVLPIGGADMPVVISLLNSFTGIAAAASGFVLHNDLLIVSGIARRRLGHPADPDDGPGHEPPAHERALRGVRPGGGGPAAAGAGATGGSVRSLGAADAAVLLAYASRVVIVPGLRPRGRPGAARRARARRPARGPADRRPLRDPPRRGPHAGAHERAAGRGRRAVPAALRDGAHQPGVRAHRRGARGRRQRRHEPRRPHVAREPDLRHADPRGRPRQAGHRAQALARHRASPASTTRSTTSRTARCCSATPRRR